jgi:hypothetical protein
MGKMRWPKENNRKKSAEALSVPSVHASDHTLAMQTLATPWEGLAMREKAP